jgi:hypothetical protein
MNDGALAVTRAAFATSLIRYRRSWGIWVLMLLAPIGARVWIGGKGDLHATIAVNNLAPVMSAAMLGVSLGIVVSTLLLPVAFVYLRSSVTRRQAWQVEETTAASRLAIVAGRFMADAAVMVGVLVVLTIAGIVIGLVAGTPGGFRPLDLVFGLWVIAGPAVLVVAALRSLCDALPITRNAGGEVLCVILWFAAILAPAIAASEGKASGGFASSMIDMPGFTAPLTASLADGPQDVRIGGGPATGGFIALDVTTGMTASGYLASRLIWVGVALLMVFAAGVAYRPHRSRKKVRRVREWRRLRPSFAGRVDPTAPPAPATRHRLVGLVIAELRLIGRGLAWRAAALLIALTSVVIDFRHMASPAALLLLIFGLTAQAGRAEQPRLLSLAATTASGVQLRRVAFVLAGTGWVVAMGAPGIARALLAGSMTPLLQALGTGAAAALVTAALAALSRSAFAPRLVLLLGWYVWLST